MIVIGHSLQGFVDDLAKFFPVFREILSAFPWPVWDFYTNIIVLLLAFAIVRFCMKFF